RHDGQIRANVGRKIDLVDDQQIASGHTRAAFARHLVAAGDVDDIDADIDELRAERRREVVAARFEEDDSHVWKARDRFVDRLVVDRRVFPDRRVGTAAGLHAADALERERAGSHQEFGVFIGVDVIRNHRNAVAVSQALAEAVEQRGLSRSDGSTYTDGDSVHWRFMIADWRSSDLRLSTCDWIAEGVERDKS